MQRRKTATGKDEGERILEMVEALDMIVYNTQIKKRDNRLITYSSCASSTKINYIHVSNQDRKLVKDVKVIPGEEVASQYCIIVSCVKIKPGREEKQLYIAKKKVWKLNKSFVKENVTTKFENTIQRFNAEDDVENLRKSLKDDKVLAGVRVLQGTK